MNVSSFIGRRIAFNRQRSFSRFIIRLATAATIISVAAMIIAMAFTNGFQFAISQKIFSFFGHIRVQHFEPTKVSFAEEFPILKNDAVAEILKKNGDIKTIQPYATKNAILKSSETIEGVLFKGVEKSYDFSNLKGFLQQGHWISFADSGYSNEINLSEYTCSQLNLKLNDQVLIYFIQANGAAPRARKLTVSGIYKTGIEEYDKLIALGDLKLIQRLNNWKENEIGGYEIFVKDYHKMDAVNEDIFFELPALWNSRTIREINPNIFDWLNLQDQSIVIVLIIMTVVAVLNLITCLIILVLERTRMVGVLKALGAPNPMVQRIFLYQGSVIALLGIFFGNLLGLGFCWLQQRYGLITLPEEMYYISKAEARVIWWQVMLVNSGTFLICFLV
ncbi:MAG TPA: FtsX-like permease family protein, partial [Chitinophagaceae bacterium]|nr:FtsX-like permease family protein [Chitinophagaceae bacterium]